MKWISQLLLLITLLSACEREDSTISHYNPVSAHLFVEGQHVIDIDTTHCFISRFGPWLQKTTHREIFRYTSGPRYHNPGASYNDYSVLHFLNLPVDMFNTFRFHEMMQIMDSAPNKLGTVHPSIGFTIDKIQYATVVVDLFHQTVIKQDPNSIQTLSYNTEFDEYCVQDWPALNIQHTYKGYAYTLDGMDSVKVDSAYFDFYIKDNVF